MHRPPNAFESTKDQSARESGEWLALLGALNRR